MSPSHRWYSLFAYTPSLGNKSDVSPNDISSHVKVTGEQLPTSSLVTTSNARLTALSPLLIGKSLGTRHCTCVKDGWVHIHTRVLPKCQLSKCQLLKLDQLSNVVDLTSCSFWLLACSSWYFSYSPINFWLLAFSEDTHCHISYAHKIISAEKQTNKQTNKKHCYEKIRKMT